MRTTGGYVYAYSLFLCIEWSKRKEFTMKKEKLLGICACIFLFALLCHPQEIIAAGENACVLWLERVLPSLFPFMVGCQILMETGFAEDIGRCLQPLMVPVFGLSGICALPFFLGLLSGYPMGAKITARLYKDGKISTDESQHILAFSNNAGPLFVVGTVATGFFGEPYWGYVLLLCSVLGAIVTGIVYRFFMPHPLPLHPHSDSKKISQNLLPRAIANSLYTTCQIGGYILLFSVLIEISTIFGVFSMAERILSFTHISQGYLTGIFGGILEMTTGSYHLSTATEDLFWRLLGVSFLLSFGGCSILGQTFGVLADVPINKKIYLLSKLANGFFSAFFFAITHPFFLFHAKKAIPVTHMFTEIAFPPSLQNNAAWCFLLFALLYAAYRHFFQRR